MQPDLECQHSICFSSTTDIHAATMKPQPPAPAAAAVTPALVMTVVLQGVRSLVMPVDKKGRPVKTLAPAKTAEDDDLMPFKTSSFTPQSATDGNSVATQLEAVKTMDPDLDGTGQLVCVIDTGISFIGNPAYGECKALNTPKGKCKVVTGYDFVGDSFTGLQTGPSAVRGGMPVRTNDRAEA